MSNLTPGTVVTVTDGGRYENGIVGYVCRTKPTNGDEVLVGVISQPSRAAQAFRISAGQRLSYRENSLTPLPK